MRYPIEPVNKRLELGLKIELSEPVSSPVVLEREEKSSLSFLNVSWQYFDRRYTYVRIKQETHYMPIYEFFCEECGNTTDETFKYNERPGSISCPACERGTAEYRVGKPAMFRIKYDQNGRVAYRMDMGNGKKIHRSATKEQYEHNVGNKSRKEAKEAKSDLNRSVYTKEYGREVESKERAKTEKFVKTLKEITKNAD